MTGMAILALGIPAAAVVAALGFERLIGDTVRMRRRTYLRLFAAAGAAELALAAALLALGGGVRDVALPVILGVLWLVFAAGLRRAWRGTLHRPVGEDPFEEGRRA